MVNTSWLKWKEVRPNITDKKMPMRLKAKVYTTVVRPVLAYGSECWGLKKKGQRKLLTTEMSMLRKMLGVTLRVRLRRRTTVMTSVVTVVEQNKLVWLSFTKKEGGRGEAGSVDYNGRIRLFADQKHRMADQIQSVWTF